MENDSTKLTSLQCQAERILITAIHMAETGMDLREKSGIGEKHICRLCNIAAHASELISEMQSSSKGFLHFAQKLCISAIKNIDSILEKDPSFLDTKEEFERLLKVLRCEIADLGDQDATDVAFNQDSDTMDMNVTLIDGRLKILEERQKLLDNTLSRPSGGSVRSFKFDAEEKYPENWSKESLGDLDLIINLPSVPEDMFAGLTKPIHSSSLCSLKSLRKVKLFLHRALSSDEEDEYECEEQDLYVSDDNSSDTEAKPKKEELDEVKTKKSAMLSLISEEVHQE